MICYVLVGGAIIEAIESEYEKKALSLTDEVLEKMLSRIYKQIESNSTRVREEGFYTFLQYEIRNFSDFFTNATINGTLTGHVTPQWDFFGSVFYCITLVSTIGYGHVTCKTKFGKVFTIVYSAIGVPLMMLFLANTGSSTATVFKFIYLRFDSIRQKYRMYKLKKHIFDADDDYEADMFDEKLELDEKFQDLSLSNRALMPSGSQSKNSSKVNRRLSRANSLPNKKKSTKSVEVSEKSTKIKPSKEDSKQEVEEQKIDKKEAETKTKKANEKKKLKKIKEIQVPRSISIGIRDVELADDVIEQLRTDFMRNAYEKEAIHRINKLINENEQATQEDLKEIPLLKDIQLKPKEFDLLNSQLNELKINENNDEEEEDNMSLDMENTNYLISGIFDDLPTNNNTNKQRTSRSTKTKNKKKSMKSANNRRESSLRFDNTTNKNSYLASISTKTSMDSKSLNSPIDAKTGFNRKFNRSVNSFDYSVYKNLKYLKYNPSLRSIHPSFSNRKDFELMYKQYEQERQKKMGVPLFITIIIIPSYLFCGMLIFSSFENWSKLDALYFCFVTLTTIGFGDLMPGSTLLNKNGNKNNIYISALYIFLGLILIAMCINLISNQIKNKLKEFAKRIGLSSSKQNHDHFHF
jgi:hypothetical protein